MTALSPNGCWTWFYWPTAVYSSTAASVFSTHVLSEGFVVVNRHRDDIGSDQRILLDVFYEDDHCLASVIELDSGGSNPGKLLIVSSQGNGTGASHSRVGSYAGSIDGFADPVAIEASVSEEHTLLQMGDTSRTIYEFYKLGNPAPEPHYFRTSTDGGASWSAKTELISDASNIVPYVQIRKTAADRIDVIFNQGHPANCAASVYHFYITVAADGTRHYYKSDGTLIGDDTTLPLTAASCSLVYDGTTTDSWVWDLCQIGSDLVAYWATFASSATVHNYWRGILSSGAWTTEQVCDGGTHTPNYLYSAEPYYSGGICADSQDEASVYVSRCYGASDFRVEKWTKTAGVWAKAVDVSGSTGSVNARPRHVDGDPSGRIVYWRGTYNSYADFATAVELA